MMILQPEARLQEKMAMCGLPRVPHHQEHVHVVLDTPTKINWCLKKPSKIKSIFLLTLLMKICLSTLPHTLTSVQEGTSEKEAKI